MSETPDQPPEPARRPNVARMLLAAAAVLLIVVGAIMLLRDDDDDSSGTTTSAQTDTGSTTAETETSTTPAPGSATTVPSVEGTQLTVAAKTLEAAGLRAAVEYLPSEQPRNSVLGQDVPAGTGAQRGDAIRLSTSTGPSPPLDVPVPDVIGKTQAEARTELERQLFEVLVIQLKAVTEDEVVSHSPGAGTRIPRGSVVIVYAGTPS